MVQFNGIAEDMIPLPPRGMNVSTCTVGTKVTKQFTYLCEEDGCYAMVSSPVEVIAREGVIGKHACPAPLRRSVFPTGRSSIEKLWDTLDDAVDAYVKGKNFLDCENLEETMGFLRGMYEAIACCSNPKYTAEEVRLEAKRRRDMRALRIPFSPTPGYRWMAPHIANGQGRDVDVIDVSPDKPVAKPKTTARRSLRSDRMTLADIVPIEKPRIFTASEENMIRSAFSSGLSCADLAKMYGVSEARIKSIADPDVSALPPLGWPGFANQ